MELWVMAILIGAGVVVGAAAIFASVAKTILFFKFHHYNHQQTQSGWTAYAATRAFLDASGLQDVKVEKSGFFRTLIMGDYYSVKKKTIYLRKRIINQSSMTAVGVGLQKVGLAIMDKQGDKKLKTRAVLLPMAFISPTLFLPIVFVGFVIDLLVGFTGVIAAIFTAVGIAFYLAALIYMLVNIPVEKKANNIALNILQQSQILTPDEIEKVDSLFKFYILSYIADFVVALLELVRDIFKLAYNIFKMSHKK